MMVTCCAGQALTRLERYCDAIVIWEDLLRKKHLISSSTLANAKFYYGCCLKAWGEDANAVIQEFEGSLKFSNEISNSDIVDKVIAHLFQIFRTTRNFVGMQKLEKLSVDDSCNSCSDSPPNDEISVSTMEEFIEPKDQNRRISSGKSLNLDVQRISEGSEHMEESYNRNGHSGNTSFEDVAFELYEEDSVDIDPAIIYERYFKVIVNIATWKFLISVPYQPNLTITWLLDKVQERIYKIQVCCC
jgi:hypothetical protein